MASFPQCLPNQATYQSWCDSISYNKTPIEHLCTPRGCQQKCNEYQQHSTTFPYSESAQRISKLQWQLSAPVPGRMMFVFSSNSSAVKSYGGFLKWGYPQIIHFNRIFRFHCKPSILGYIHVYIPHFRNPPYEIIASQTWHHSSSFHFMCTMSKPRSAIQRKPCAIKSRSPPSQPSAASPPFPHITGMGCSHSFNSGHKLFSPVEDIQLRCSAGADC